MIQHGFSFILLLLISLNCMANEVITLSDKQGQYDIGHSVSILTEHGESLTIKNILSPSLKKQFKQSQSADPGFGFTTNTYWLKFSVNNQRSNQDSLILQIANPLLDDIQFYSRENNAFVLKNSIGRNYPVAQRDIKHHFYLIKINPPRNQITDYYLRVQSADNLTIPLSIWDVETHRQYSYNEQAVLGIYYGAVIVMILYNLFLFFSFKDRNYLLYVASIFVSHLVVQACFNGYIAIYFLPDSSEILKLLTPVSACVAAILASLFAISFLHVRNYAINFYYFLNLQIAWLIGLILLMISGGYGEYTYLVPASIVVTACSSLAIGVICLVRGFRAARYYLLAWGVFSIGVLSYIGLQFGFVPVNIFTQHSMQLGAALEMTLMSMALGDRINMMMHEKVEIEEKLNQILVQSEQFKNQFLNNISHEFRTPLNAIIGFSEMLQEEVAELDPEEAIDDLKRIEESGYFLLSIVNRLLEFTKAESGVDDYRPQMVVLKHVISAAVEAIKKHEKTNNNQLTLNCPDSIQIENDPYKLGQIFANIISNAYKFTKNGEITITVSNIKRNEQKMVMISIKDTGIGMDDMGKIFQMFNQLDNSDTRAYGGLGVGLSLVHRLCEMINAEIDVKSKKNKGTDFQLYLMV